MVRNLKLSQNEILFKIAGRMFVLLLLGISCSSWAALHPRSYQNDQAFSPDLINAYYQIKSEHQESALSKIALDDIQTMNSTQALSAIADRGFNTWWNSEQVRSSVLGASAQAVEKTVNKEVVFGEAEVQHKLQFQVLAFQAKARINYEGLARASVSYNAHDASTGVEVFEKLNSQKDLVLSHNVSSFERTSQVSLRWNW